MRRRSLVGLTVVGVVAWVAMCVALPSGHPVPDGLDELMRIEAGGIVTNARHPLSEPVMDLLFGGRPAAMRTVQCWNAAWMAIALLGLGLGDRTSRRGPAAALLGASTYAALLAGTDPFLSYVPPSIALGSLAWAFRARLVPALLLCTLSALFFPPALVFAAAIAVERTDHPRTAAVAVGVPTVVTLAAIAGSALEIGRPLSFPALDELLRDGVAAAFLPIERGFGLLRVVDHPTSPAAWLTLVVGVSLMAWVVRGASLGLPSAGMGLLLGAGLSGVFFGLWDPANEPFWLLSLWLLLLRWVEVGADPRPAAALGATLLALNVACYVVPAAQTPSPHIAAARELGSQLGPADFVVSLELPPLYVAYFGGLRADGPPARLPEMREALLETRDRGGLVYVEVSAALPEGITIVRDVTLSDGRKFVGATPQTVLHAAVTDQ